MVTSCSVPGCSNRRTKGSNISFHKFPLTDPLKCDAWLKSLARVNIDGTPWIPTIHSNVCSQHFLPADFELGPSTRILRRNAVPSQFPTFPSRSRHISPPQREHFFISSERGCQTYYLPSTEDKVNLDHCYSSPAPEEVIRKLEAALVVETAKLSEKNRELKMLRMKLKRREDRLSSLLTDLNSQKTISLERLDELSMDFDAEVLNLKENQSRLHDEASNNCVYSDDLMQFAINLNSYSEEGYKLLRRHLKLPHPSRLSRLKEGPSSHGGSLGSVPKDCSGLRRLMPADGKGCNVAVSDSISPRNTSTFLHKKEESWDINFDSDTQISDDESVVSSHWPPAPDVIVSPKYLKYITGIQSSEGNDNNTAVSDDKSAEKANDTSSH